MYNPKSVIKTRKDNETMTEMLRTLIEEDVKQGKAINVNNMGLRFQAVSGMKNKYLARRYVLAMVPRVEGATFEYDPRKQETYHVLGL